MHCEVQIDECAGVSCSNGGTCHDMIGYYLCACPNGYHGDHCEKEYDRCQSNPCRHGATCIDDGHAVYCKCATGFFGKLCQKGEVFDRLIIYFFHITGIN